MKRYCSVIGKTTLRVLYFFLIAVMSLFIIVTGYFTIKLFISPSDIPSFFGITFFNSNTDLKGSSIHKGDFLVILPVSDMQTLSIGDIIVYNDGTYENSRPEVTFHTVSRVDYNGMVSVYTSDGNNVKFEKINSNKIVGRYYFSVPFIGKVMKKLNNPAIMLVCSTSPIIIFMVISYLVKKRKTKTEKENKKCKKTNRRFEDTD